MNVPITLKGAIIMFRHMDFLILHHKNYLYTKFCVDSKCGLRISRIHGTIPWSNVPLLL